MRRRRMRSSPRIVSYDRERAVAYAHQWAFKRNPRYFDFEKLGGDCTNFASQVIYAGSGVMNYTPTYGWYYSSSSNRTPSWTGVDFLHNFLVGNQGVGPFAEVVDIKDAQPGDIVQFSFHGGKDFDHSPVIVRIEQPVSLDRIFVAAHTIDRDDYKLTNYEWVDMRILHITGVRKKV